MSQTITINGLQSFKIDDTDGKTSINGVEKTLDCQKINEHTYHVLYNGNSFTIEVLSCEKNNGLLKINGKEYTFATSDPYDDLLNRLGMNAVKKNGTAQLKAPMPGMVLDILVKPGDVLSKGDNLLVLEAMKMENIIKASHGATVRSIDIHKGAKVEKNQVLLTFE